MAGECNLKRRPARLEAQGAQPAASDCGPPAAAAAAAPPQDLQAAAAPAAAQAGLDSAQLEAAAACRFDSLLQLFPLLMHGATQAATLRGWRGMPGSEVFQRVTSTLLVGLFWVLPTFFPAFYMRRRTLSILLSRASFFAWPLLRKPRGIQHVLDAAAQPGVRGALHDLMKVIWGSRLVAVLLSSCITPLSILPLGAHLLLQQYAVLMVRSNSSICAAPLLTHPLTRGRIAGFHFVMRLLACVLPGGVGSALLEGRGQGSVSAAAECESFLTCLSVVVALLLPAYVAVKTEPADSLQRWEAAQLSRAAGAGSGAAGGPAARLQQALARFEASVGGGIRHVFCGRSWLAGERPAAGPEPGLPVRQLAWYERLGAWWLLLALVYQLAVQAAAAA